MFINYYLPSRGGMETSVINLCSGLEKAGHRTFIFAPEYPNYIDKDKNIFRYKSAHFSYKGYFYVIPVPFFSNAGRIAESLELDLIHSHQPYSLGNEALKYSRKLGIPLVFTYHIRYEDYAHYIPFIPQSISKKYIKKITINYSNKCNAVIAPSTVVEKLLLGYGIKTPIKVIPSGINIQDFRRDAGKREETRKKYGIRQDSLILITASRIAEEKNIGFLIESFGIVKKSCPNTKFIIVGEGAVKRDLEKMAEDLGISRDVIFTGLATREEIINLYQASDIFVFASLTETQGLVAVEAMSSGLPVIAVKAGGVEDMIENGFNGVMAKNSIGEFSEKVIEVINKKDLRGKLSNGAKINSNKFTIELWTEKILKLYRSLI